MPLVESITVSRLSPDAANSRSRRSRWPVRASVRAAANRAGGAAGRPSSSSTARSKPEPVQAIPE